MIVAERVRAELTASTRFGLVYEFSTIDSTNRWLLDAAGRGAPDGTVVVADHQQAGRGRLRRSWEAPPGAGLLMSVLLRPADLPSSRRHLLTAAMGLAAQAAALHLGAAGVELKWPNDLVVGQAKLAGVLAQASGDAVVVGLGCNVSWAPPGATCLDALSGSPVDRGALLATLLGDLDRRLGNWEGVARTYRATCATVGRRVRLELGDGSVEGRAEGIDADGRLLLRHDLGELQAVAVGDVVHLHAGGGPDVHC